MYAFIYKMYTYILYNVYNIHIIYIMYTPPRSNKGNGSLLYTMFYCIHL